MISLNEFGPPDDESSSEEGRALVEKCCACDIVHGWDDWEPGGLAAVWGKVFREALAP